MFRTPRIRVERLSGGQRQGVAFARAANLQSRYFLLDEPTAATGVKETREIVKLILTLRDRGAGILLVSHDIPLVAETSDRIFVLKRGSIARTFDERPHIDDIVLAIAEVRLRAHARGVVSPAEVYDHRYLGHRSAGRRDQDANGRAGGALSVASTHESRRRISSPIG